jgi:uncharacterized protein (DUF1501 family)
MADKSMSRRSFLAGGATLLVTALVGCSASTETNKDADDDGA